MNRSADLSGIGMTSQRTRERLVQRLVEQGITNVAVLDAMRNVPRHLFLDEAMAHRAYEDTALPIGYQQTLSQPYIVARMTELLIEGRSTARCSRSAAAPVTRVRGARGPGGRGLRPGAHQAAAAGRAQAHAPAQAAQRADAPRRRFRGLGFTGALRRHPCARPRRSEVPQALARAARAGRPPGDARRPLAVFAAGAAAGLLTFSRLLHRLLRDFHAATLATLTGFLLGSLLVVWPWKLPRSADPDALSAPVSPSLYAVQAGDAQFLACLLLGACGLAAVWLLENRWGGPER
jgi:hypothetical protein